MVPSLTEVLFALGVGDRVVGVTDWCKWPPEARRKRHMGGYTDPNYEAIAAVNPDLVLTMPEQTELRKGLERLGIRAVAVGQRSVAEILNSIMAVGRTCGVEVKARNLVSELKERMRSLSSEVRELPRPRVLVGVDRSPVGTGKIENFYAAGGRGFYDELITRAGGINACDVTAVEYPCLSKEGLIGMDPDIVIELLPGLAKKGVTVDKAVSDWNELPMLGAVKSRRIHIVTEDFAVIPGPRFVRILELFARLIHPEVKWGNS